MYNNSTRKSLRQRVQKHSDGTREYWRDVPGWEGFVRVSDQGRVKSLARVVKCKDPWGGYRLYPVKSKYLKPKPNKATGYRTVLITGEKIKKRKSIHNLVLNAFVGRCPPGKQCRHLDGNKLNNKLSNLRWGTPKQNSQDRVIHGTQVRGNDHPLSKLSPTDIPLIHKLYESGLSCKKIANRLGVRCNIIKGVLSGKTYAQHQPNTLAVMRPSGFQIGHPNYRIQY